MSFGKLGALGRGFGRLGGPLGIANRPLYLGPVATRAWIPNQKVAAQKQIMATSFHDLRADVTGIALLEPGYHVTAAGVETAPGAPGTCTAGLLSGGSMLPFLWSGFSSGSVPDGGYLISDILPISLAAGTRIKIKRYRFCTGGIYISGGLQDNANGDLVNYSTSTTPGALDTTTSAANQATNGDFGNHFLPAGVLAYTGQGTVFFLGDSLAFSSNDVYSGASGNIGYLARAIGPSYGWIDGGIGGTKAQAWASTMPLSIAIANMASTIILEPGVNGFSSGSTAAQELGYRTTIRSFFPGKQVIDTTVTPISLSSDNWATTGNQTAAAWNGQRTSFNDSIRGLSNVYDVADAVESSRNSGIWKANYTDDGTHLKAGVGVPAASSAVNLSMIR